MSAMLFMTIVIMFVVCMFILLPKPKSQRAYRLRDCFMAGESAVVLHLQLLARVADPYVQDAWDCLHGLLYIGRTGAMIHPQKGQGLVPKPGCNLDSRVACNPLHARQRNEIRVVVQAEHGLPFVLFKVGFANPRLRLHALSKAHNAAIVRLFDTGQGVGNCEMERLPTGA
jgi:hypothetical protein